MDDKFDARVPWRALFPAMPLNMAAHDGRHGTLFDFCGPA
jgi:hypothetical protein